MSELKPCPFCGGSAGICVTKKTVRNQYAVRCNTTRCIAYNLGNPFVMHYLSQAEAINAWNRRADNDQF